MRTLVGLLSAFLLTLLVASEARAAGLERGTLPAGVVQARPPVVRDQYAWDAAQQIRRWTDFTVRISVPAWIPGVTGTFGSGSGDIEGPDGDKFDKLFDAEGALSFALVGRVELRHGRWGLNADGFAATITENISFKPTGGDKIASGDITGVLIRGDVNYLLGEHWFRLKNRKTRLQVRGYAGVRSYNVHLTVNQVLGQDIKEDVRGEWIDPIVGVRAAWDISRKLSVRLEGDIGGFGAGSNMAYWASIHLQWRFSRVIGLALGYSFLDFEREFHFSGERYKWQAQLFGPMLALGFQF